MSSYLDDYIKRVSLGCKNRKDKLRKQSERTFERQLQESPSAKRLRATIPNQIDILNNTNEIDCLIVDIADNDIKAFDQKYIMVKTNENFDLGCYVEFDGAFWIAGYREHKTVGSHKKFTLYKCNNIWSYKKNGVVYKFPIYVQNLSLYSDGLADNVYTSVEDGKISIFYGENPITKSIKLNTRIMISNRLVLRVTNINDYEFKSNHNATSAIKTLLLQTAATEKDDFENNIAWNEESENKSIDDSVLKIVGDKKVMLGSKKTYKSSREVDYRHWEIECDPQLRKVIDFKTIAGDKYCEIKFPSNVQYVGETIRLKMFVSNVLQDILDITIKSV